MRTTMYERLLEIEANESWRAIVLQGAAGNLCAGGDISEMRRREINEARVRMDLPTRIFKLLVNGPKPFLCAAMELCAFGEPFDAAEAAIMENGRLALSEGWPAAAAQITPTQQRLYNTEDAAEGVRSFTEKRDARFVGR